jgi:hypothetical protein
MNLAKEQKKDKLKAVAEAEKEAGVVRAKPHVDRPGEQPLEGAKIPEEWPRFFDTDRLILKGFVFRPIGFREEDKVLELQAVGPSMVLRAAVDKKLERKKVKNQKQRGKKKRRKR